MKRLPGQNAPGARRRQLLLSALVIAALISVLGTLAAAIGLYRGIAQIQSGLARLNDDFSYQLPGRPDELGEISRSINQMSRVRRELEVKLRREDRLSAIGRLAAGIAHEIRNPLNSIRLTMQLLEQRLKAGTTKPEHIQLVINEVDRMNGLVTGLLDLQRTRHPELAARAVSPVLEKYIALVDAKAKAQNCHINLSASSELCAMFDDQQLTQALVNLLLNALDVSAENESVIIEAREYDAFVEIAVSDSGPGLTKEEQEHLFEAFYSTKSNGTGLGSLFRAS